MEPPTRSIGCKGRESTVYNWQSQYSGVNISKRRGQGAVGAYKRGPNPEF